MSNDQNGMDRSPRRVRVWMKAEENGQTFISEGFGPNLGAANQHALEQIDAIMRAVGKQIAAE